MNRTHSYQERLNSVVATSLEDKSLQEIFQTVESHLLAQNAKSTEGGVCRYRTSTGLMCAVGCLIPDELYSEDLECFSVDFPKRGYAEPKLKLTYELQRVHDDFDPEDWRAILNSIAVKWLDVSKVDLLLPTESQEICHDSN